MISPFNLLSEDKIKSLCRIFMFAFSGNYSVQIQADFKKTKERNKLLF
ncbi:MAG: hypothetical protein KatS3mg034_0036 [Vicingaceae bacterium]|nr:MAG: hypothetical protein KatS3mg034_0036 [Vicingaceae bacterium]